MTATSTEDFLPILSAGRHRNAKRGACFMEFASYLAGERWSDHPACTDQSLSALARLVNDLTSDRARSELSVLIPSVVGLTGSNPRVSTLLSVLAASHALPIASAMRQSALASALVRARSMLDTWSGPEVERAHVRISRAFELTPGAEDWGREFVVQVFKFGRTPIAVNDEAILRTALVGIADACVEDPDAELALLLREAIHECQLIFGDQRGLARTSEDELAIGVPMRSDSPSTDLALSRRR